MIISLNGWPGVGKLSVGMALSELTGARLLDNHSLFNVAIALTEFGSAAYYDAARAVREVAFQCARALPRTDGLILTNVHATGGPAGFAEEHWQEILKLADHRASPLISVTLVCEPDELARRIVSVERARHRKIRDPAVLEELRSRRSLFDDGASYRHTIDVTHVLPHAAASEIAAWVSANVDAQLKPS